MDDTAIKEIGPWTFEEKLAILRDYLAAYVRATKKAKTIYYVDAFAGPGKCKVRDTGEIVDGSPLIALKMERPFTHYFFIDASPEAVRSLESHVKAMPKLQNRATVILGDCNGKIDGVLPHIPQAAPCFVFLDPEGSELEWSTIVRIARHKISPPCRKIEQLILFPYDMALVRFMPLDPSKLVHARLIDRVMPDPQEWRRIYRARVGGDMTEGEVRRAFVRMYTSGLKHLGYRCVPHPRMVRGPRGPLYFLVFAGDHPVGQDIITYVFNKQRGRVVQLSFLERRYEEEY